MKSTLALVAALAAAPFLVHGARSSSALNAARESGVLTLQATDAYRPRAHVAEARIDLAAVHLATGLDGERRTIHTGAVIAVLLTDLRAGALADLAHAVLPADTYTDVFFEVTGGYLRLENGAEYSTELGNLKLPAGAATLHEHIVPALALSDAGGQLLLDFDLATSFRPIPAGDPLEAIAFELTPTLRALDKERTGTLQGVVSRASGRRMSTLEEAGIYVLPAGTLDPSNKLTSSSSGWGGSFKVLGLEEGSYDVLVEFGSERGTALDVSITPGKATTIDVVVKS